MTAEVRRVEVPAERLAGWLERFAQRHGGLTCGAAADAVTVRAADDTVAVCEVPFAPLVIDADTPYGGLVEHALTDRRVGVVLVRKGGYAAGVFAGTELVASKVGSRLVQSRSAAGGTSQQRFARRRENQARAAYRAAADTVAGVLLPVAGSLDAVVLGGDRQALEATLADPRLAPLRTLVTGRTLAVVDPRLRVLQATPVHFRAVHIALTDPTADEQVPGA